MAQTKSLYEIDIVAWANAQAAALRAGTFDALDLENLAEEIEDVGKSEARELQSRMAVLIAHLLKWQYQPERRSKSWIRTIGVQRTGILRRLETTPSLKPKLNEAAWFEEVWADAQATALEDVALSGIPEQCPYSITQCLDSGYFPE
jgi:hypothetical protein